MSCELSASCIWFINSFLARGELLFANNLEPDQDGQNVSLDGDPNHLTL